MALKNQIPTALRLAASLQWAVTPEYLDIIEAVASGQTDPVAVATELGRPLANTRTVTYRGNVAVIPVHSVIFRRASMLDEISGGAASVQTIAVDLKAAEADPAIDTVVFDFDTPGGEVNGISELAGLIKNSPLRTIAYVGYMAGSAGYWAAAACDEIVIHKTATVGSIGIMCIANTFKDPTKKRFVSRQSPDKNAPADSTRGAQLIQDEIDKTCALFIQDVADFRGLDAQTIEQKYGAGAMVLGADAVEAGMADRLGTFEELMTELQLTGKPEVLGAYAVSDAAVNAFTQQATAAMKTDSKDDEDMTKEILAKMLAGLSEDERKEVLATLGVTETIAAADVPATAPATPPVEAAPAAAAVVPPVTPAVPAVPAVAAAAASAGVDVTALQTQLATEKAGRITAECSAFVTSMKAAGKLTPAEEATVTALYGTLAAQADPAALNSYKASLEARPVNPMLKEQVAANGNLQVLGNTGAADTRTEAEKEAALVEAMLASTPDGQTAAKSLAAGEIKPAFKQFAVNQ